MSAYAGRTLKVGSICFDKRTIVCMKAMYQKWREVRQNCLASMFLPFLFFVVRYVADMASMGSFMCSERAQTVATFLLAAAFGLLAISMWIDVTFVSKKANWMGRIEPEEYARVAPPPRPLKTIVFANFMGVVLIYLLDLIGCKLLA